MSAAQLAQALAILPRPRDENMLVGVNTADDAGVYKVRDDMAIVYTIDILTPVVADPYIYGMIVAANSISDIYAMGGDPKLALNIIGFPLNGDPEAFGQMLLGGQAKAEEAGVVIIGGHTFAAKEIKYGLSVMGYIHPDKIITNANAQPGDIIILTKPIGVGTIVSSSLIEKDKKIDLKPLIESMTTLNRDACLAMMQADAHAATDITGYGLMGHLVEMADGSKVGFELYASKIPTFKGALEVIKRGIEEPGIVMNLTSFSSHVDTKDIDKNLSKLIFGSETSGGLAIVLPEEKLKIFQDAYKKPAPVIGRVTKENPGRVIVK